MTTSPPKKKPKGANAQCSVESLKNRIKRLKKIGLWGKAGITAYKLYKAQSGIFSNPTNCYYLNSLRLVEFGSCIRIRSNQNILDVAKAAYDDPVFYIIVYNDLFHDEIMKVVKKYVSPSYSGFSEAFKVLVTAKLRLSKISSVKETEKFMILIRYIYNDIGKATNIAQLLRPEELPLAANCAFWKGVGFNSNIHHLRIKILHESDVKASPIYGSKKAREIPSNASFKQHIPDRRFYTIRKKGVASNL